MLKRHGKWLDSGKSDLLRIKKKRKAMVNSKNIKEIYSSVIVAV